MRLIDADALEQEIDAMWDIGFTPEVVRCSDCKYRRELTLMDFCNIVRFAPTVDAVQVVRCRDCEHSFYKDGKHDGGYYCTLRMYEHEYEKVRPLGFCDAGERRD